MLKDNSSKIQKKLLEQHQNTKILIRRRLSHYLTLAQANYYLNLFHTILCAVSYPGMRASKYNTDASFILPNTIGPSANPWRISKPKKDHTLVPDPGHKPYDPGHSNGTFCLDSLWPRSSPSLNRFLPRVTGEFHQLKNNIFKAQNISQKSTKITAQNNASQF